MGVPSPDAPNSNLPVTAALTLTGAKEVRSRNETLKRLSPTPFALATATAADSARAR